MVRLFLAAASAISLITVADAAPVTYELEQTASYGSTYGSSPILAPINWTFGFTFDPDTITPTSQGAAGYNTSTFYDGSTGLTGYLRKGSETAIVDHIEAQFSTASLNRHSFTIRYVLDPAPFNTPATCGNPLLCDDDQNDGLSLTYASGSPSSIDVNQVQFTFSGNRSTPTFFTGPATLADTSLDWLGSSEALVSTNMSVFGYGIAGSLFGVLGNVTDPTGRSFTTLEGNNAAVPLPAAGWMFLTGLCGLAAATGRGTRKASHRRA